ncbi:MAG TPA: FHA domain-containing protein, partial [Thermomicrobiales bacterium]|nr:FHA domain-containing protein [Thermomicrobiales bacterium]
MSAPFRLVVEDGPHAGQHLAVGGAGLTIGRQDGNDLVLDDARISRQHARLEVRGGDLVVTDLGSANGTRINGRAVSGSQPLRPGDVLQLGGTKLRLEAPAAPAAPAPLPVPVRGDAPTIAAPDLPTGPLNTGAPAGPRLVVENGPGAGREYPLDRASLVIGRHEASDIVLEDTQASRQHARFTVRDGQVTVTDLGSANGTRVNGQPAAGSQALRPGDEVQVGTTLLRFVGGGAPPAQRDLTFGVGRVLPAVPPPPLGAV